MNSFLNSLAPALPEIFVFSMACVILMAGVFLSEKRRFISCGLALVALVGAAVLTIKGFGSGGIAFNGMFVGDALADTLKLAIYLVVFFVLVYSRDYLHSRDMYKSEYFVLALFAVTGMMIMVSAAHFLTLYLGLELLSLSLYAMVAFRRDSAPATEAAMKYFVLGALASGMLLYGMSMLYGATGSLDIGVVHKAIAGMAPDNMILIFGLVFVIVGLAFKLGVAPFHMWAPDVYHGAPTAVTVFLGTAPKLAAFAMLMRLLVGGLEGLAPHWQQMLVIMAILSLATGNIIAIAQTNIKRMLAYSTIAHMGFFLLGMLAAGPNGYASAMFYMLIYVVMSLGAFGMVILLSRQGFEADRLEDFKGLNQRSPWFAFLMLLLMFSMAGVPPTAGFYAKLLVIQAVIDAGYLWLAAVAVLFSVIGAYYYLRVVKLMYFDKAADSAPLQVGADMRTLLSVNALALVLITPWIGTLMDLCT
ncbi:MAG TPA: NADH-quinone oxidoreductase subunit NuoN, partial [Acidiferrobacterales bacterium]|nr:NADH-quinone oxidoreductase subunit NuoN [Acidiferrobacterales bacterium]